jgi:hypothetical protein
LEEHGCISRQRHGRIGLSADVLNEFTSSDVLHAHAASGQHDVILNKRVGHHVLAALQGVLDGAAQTLVVLPELAEEEGNAHKPAGPSTVLPVREVGGVEDPEEIVELHACHVHQHPEIAVLKALCNYGSRFRLGIAALAGDAVPTRIVAPKLCCIP